MMMPMCLPALLDWATNVAMALGPKSILLPIFLAELEHLVNFLPWVNVGLNMTLFIARRRVWQAPYQ
eukprot:5610897-Karenia_brevis.AAC.1